MDTFQAVDRWTIRYHETSIRWRAPPPVSLLHIARLLSRKDHRPLIDALNRFPVSRVRSAERMLSELAGGSDNLAVVSASARLLRYGSGSTSLHALKGALARAIEARHDASLVDCVAGLYHRGQPEPLQDLVRYGESQDVEALGRLVGAALAQGLPADVWPSSQLSRMERSGAARPVAMRILLERGDPAAERFFSVGLTGPQHAREQAVAALAWVRNERATKLLRSALSSEQDPALRSFICAMLGRQCGTAERLEILARASEEESPVVRFQAAQQLVGLVPKRARLRIARDWLAREPDRFIRHILRSRG